MRFVFSDVGRPSRAAKDISRFLRSRDAAAPLTRCQLAVARACGYRDWAELAAVARSGAAASLLDAEAGPEVAASRRRALAASLRDVLGAEEALAEMAAAAFPPTGTRPPARKAFFAHELPEDLVAAVAASEMDPRHASLDDLLAEHRAVHGDSGDGLVASVRRARDAGLDAWLDAPPVGREWGAPGWEELVGVPPALEQAYAAALAAALDVEMPAARPATGYGPMLETMAKAARRNGVAWDALARETLSRLRDRKAEAAPPAAVPEDTKALTPPREEGPSVPPVPPGPGSSRRVAIMPWEESERGWGTRPDGFSIHPDADDYRTFLKAYWDRMPDSPPDEYERPRWQEPRLVTVPGDHPVALAVDAGTRRVYRHAPDGLHAAVDALL